MCQWTGLLYGHQHSYCCHDDDCVMLCVLVIFVDYSVCLHHHLQYGRTPLEVAKECGRQSVVNYLVTVGEY